MEISTKHCAKATCCSAACLALFAALCTAVPAYASVVEIITDPPVQFLDGEKKAKYIVAVDRDGDAAEPPALPGMRTIVMADRTGKKYTCKMPAADQDAAKNGSTAGKEEAHLKETKQQSTPSELLDDLTGLCFYRAEDWWTYEVCYKRHVRQFHREHTQDGSMKIAVEYSLGNYNASGVDTDLVQVDTSPGQKQVKFVSQLYDKGETCDLTGGTRQTEVRYSCGEGAKDLIVSIKEPSTCHYVMSVRTPRVCPHPEFRIEQLPVSHILCSAMPVQLGADQKAGAEQTDREGPGGQQQGDEAAAQAAAEPTASATSGGQQQGDEAAAQAAVEPTASATSGGQQQGNEAAAHDVGMGDGDSDDRGTDESPGIQPGSSPAEPDLQPDSQPASDEQSEDARTHESAEGGAVHEAAGDGSTDAAPVMQHDEL